MGCCIICQGILRIHFCGDRGVFYCHVHSIGEDDVMSENSIVFMFIIGCATVLALFGMYVVRKG